MTPLPTLRALLTLFSLTLLAGLAWYIYTDKPLVITPLGYLGSCMDDDAVGECSAYLVDNTSWLHRDNDKAALRAHALGLARRRGGQGPLHVHYFRPTGWTKENQASIASNTLEELAQ